MNPGDEGKLSIFDYTKVRQSKKAAIFVHLLPAEYQDETWRITTNTIQQHSPAQFQFSSPHEVKHGRP